MKSSIKSIYHLPYLLIPLLPYLRWRPNLIKLSSASFFAFTQPVHFQPLGKSSASAHRWPRYKSTLLSCHWIKQGLNNKKQEVRIAESLSCSFSLTFHLQKTLTIRGGFFFHSNLQQDTKCRTIRWFGWR